MSSRRKRRRRKKRKVRAQNKNQKPAPSSEIKFDLNDEKSGKTKTEKTPVELTFDIFLIELSKIKAELNEVRDHCAALRLENVELSKKQLELENSIKRSKESDLIGFVPPPPPPPPLPPPCAGFSNANSPNKLSNAKKNKSNAENRKCNPPISLDEILKVKLKPTVSTCIYIYNCIL